MKNALKVRLYQQKFQDDCSHQCLGASIWIDDDLSCDLNGGRYELVLIDFIYGIFAVKGAHETICRCGGRSPTCQYGH